MARSRTVEIQIVGDADSAQRAFRQVDDAGVQTQSKFQKFSSGMSTQAKVMAAGVGAGALAVGKDLYMLGADLEQMRAKSEIVFGDQIGLVDSWAKANANAMGLTRNEAVGLSANFADLLIPMGMSREEAAKMSTEVIGLSGALSAWSGGQRTATEVAEILQSAMLGETDSLKGLGIAISAADIEQRLLANGQAELTGKAREQAEALAIQQLIMEKSTDAQAAFNDGIQSTNEKMAEQKAKFAEAKEMLATQLTPAVNEAVVALSNFVAAGTQANETSGGLQGAAYKVGAAWADATADIKETDGVLGDLLRTMEKLNTFNPVYQAGKAIGGLIPGRASGGPVSAGMPYVVGEKRPELFVPNVDGTIVPKIPAAIGWRGGGGGGGGTQVVVNFNGVTTRDAADQVVRVLEQHFARGGSLGNQRGGTLRPA